MALRMGKADAGGEEVKSDVRHRAVMLFTALPMRSFYRLFMPRILTKNPERMV